jgi:hypothetical protein
MQTKVVSPKIETSIANVDDSVALEEEVGAQQSTKRIGQILWALR